MPDTKKQKNIPILEQFNSLIESDIPNEYKDILKSFYEQGGFYSQLIQSISDKSDLSAFWDLPNTLGFNQTSDKNSDWFRSFFDINGFSNTSNESMAEQFKNTLEQFSSQTPDNLKDFQAALSTMSVLHGQISQQAMERFQQLQEKDQTHSSEQLCALWLQAGEETFKDISQSDEYIQTQQSLFSSLSELRQTQQQLSEQLTYLLGLPSTDSVKDLQKGLHALRMEFAEYKEQTDAKIDQLTTLLNNS